MALSLNCRKKILEIKVQEELTRNSCEHLPQRKAIFETLRFPFYPSRSPGKRRHLLPNDRQRETLAGRAADSSGASPHRFPFSGKLAPGRAAGPHGRSSPRPTPSRRTRAEMLNHEAEGAGPGGLSLTPTRGRPPPAARTRSRERVCAEGSPPPVPPTLT